MAYTLMQHLGPLLCKARRYRRLKSAYKLGRIWCIVPRSHIRCRAHTAYHTKCVHYYDHFGYYWILFGYSCVQQHFEWILPLTKVEKTCDQQLAVMLSYIHEFDGEESMTDHTAKIDI